MVIKYPGLHDEVNGEPLAAGLNAWQLDPARAPKSRGDKTSSGINLDFSLTYDGTLLPGWQVTPGVFYARSLGGRTPNLSATFTEDARSMNLYLNFVRNPASWQISSTTRSSWAVRRPTTSFIVTAIMSASRSPHLVRLAVNGSVKLPEAPTRGLLSYVEGVVQASPAGAGEPGGIHADHGLVRRTAAHGCRLRKQLPVGHEYIETFEAYRNDLLGEPTDHRGQGPRGRYLERPGPEAAV